MLADSAIPSLAKLPDELAGSPTLGRGAIMLVAFVIAWLPRHASSFPSFAMRTLSFVEESLSPRRLEMIMIMVRMVMAVAGLRVELLDPLRHCWVDNAWRGG